MLLTYNLHIRNTDPRFHLVSCYKKHFQVSNEKCCFLYVGCTVVIVNNLTDFKTLQGCRNIWKSFNLWGDLTDHILLKVNF